MNLRRFAPARGDLIDGGFALLLTIIGLYAFDQSYGGTEYLIVGALCAALGLVVAHIGNRLSVPVVVMVPVLFLTYAVLGGAIALRDRAYAGVIPSLDTVVDALRASVLGWKQLLTTVPPVGSLGSLMAIPAFCGTMAAGAAMLWAHRVRAVAPPAIAPTAVMVTGLLFGLKSPVSVVLHGAVFAALIVVWVALRNWRLRKVVVVGAHPLKRVAAGAAFAATASLAGLVCAPLLPFASADDRVTVREVVEPPFDPAVYPSPLSSYREYVKRYEKDTLFTITGLPEGAPIRLATMDDFDGVVWRVSGGGQASPGASGYFERVGSRVGADFQGEVTTITVEIQLWSQVWLPTVGEVLEVRFVGERARELADAFRYNRATDTGATQGVILRAGDSYEMDVVLPPASAAAQGQDIIDLQGKNSDSGIPDELIAWSAPLVRTTELRGRPEKLVEELASAGVYSDGNDDEGQKQEPSLGGHGNGRLRDFITQPEPIGNAEQFAAAMALMLRSDAVPSRVMMGFLPRTWTEDPINITGKDAEAWVEVPYTNVGWVRFAPTPPREKTEPTDEPVARPQPERNTQVPPPPPILAEDPRSEPSSESGDDEQDDPEEVLPDSGGGVPQWVKIAAVVAGPPLLVIGAFVGGVLFLKARRRRRRRLTQLPHRRVAGGWLELIDHAADLGRPVPTSTTRREAAFFVSPSATALAYRADAAVWGGREPSDEEVDRYWSDLVGAFHEMDSQVTLVRRVRSRVSPRSLLAARSARRRAVAIGRQAARSQRTARLRQMAVRRRKSAPSVIEAQRAVVAVPARSDASVDNTVIRPPRHQ